MKRCLLATLALCLALAPAVHAEGLFSDVTYSLNIGLGSAKIIKPDEFDADYNPAFGMMLDVGAQKSWVELVADFDFSFYFRKGSVPNDINILNVFLLLKIKPLESTVRPYILAGGGYYRFWIWDLNHFENVLGYAGGAGIEVEINKRQRLFLEGKYVQGQTRETPGKANTEAIPVRLGLTWVF